MLYERSIYKAIFELMEYKKESERIDVYRYVKFTSQNDDFSYSNFSDTYLNRFNWTDRLKEANILPVLNTNKFVSIKSKNCIIVPEVLSYIYKNTDIKNSSTAVVIDTYKKTQYIPLLKAIGCRISNILENLSCIKKASEELINDEKFRKVLYSYLNLLSTQQEIKSNGLYDMVKQLPIFPIRTSSGVRYESYSNNIYTHDTKISDKNFKILETKILDYKSAQDIVGPNNRINELIQEVYDSIYQKNLIAYIESNRTDEEIAIYVLNEYKNNSENFNKCHNTLKGMISEIPMKFVNGNYHKGNKFVNNKKLILSGETIKNLVVSDDFVNLAKYLGCSDILDIHYDDIEDFQNEFTYGMKILEGLIRNEIITDKQIEKFHLQYFFSKTDYNYSYEEFPGKKVVNLVKLRKHIQDKFKNNPNPYIENNRIVYEPKFPVNKDFYTTTMYRSEENQRNCFCQMCQEIVPKIYIEKNNVQKNPKYGWEQMYLNLCLKCSKDFILLRNIDSVWNDFIARILTQNVENVENVEIPIGDKRITFTATHLAEIQTILQLEEE